jgi:hypothetical protein
MVTRAQRASAAWGFRPVMRPSCRMHPCFRRSHTGGPLATSEGCRLPGDEMAQARTPAACASSAEQPRARARACVTDIPWSEEFSTPSERRATPLMRAKIRTFTMAVR